MCLYDAEVAFSPSDVGIWEPHQSESVLACMAVSLVSVPLCLFHAFAAMLAS